MELKNSMEQLIITTPLVSIIVITYNSSKYVLDTLESAKSQTYQNIELIVSDDCSTDNTVEICRKWIEENKSRFVRTELVTSSKNTGIPSNCNRGLKATTGDWIKLIAGDDIFLKKCIEDILNFAFSSKSLFVYSDLEVFCEADVLPYKKDLHLLAQQKKFSSLKTSIQQYRYYLRYPIFLNTPTFFINAKVFSLVDNYDEKYKILEDQIFVIKALKANFYINYYNAITVRYRRNVKTISHSIFQTADTKKCYNELRRPFLKYYNLKDLVVIYHTYIINLKIENFFLRKLRSFIMYTTDVVFIKQMVFNNILLPFSLKFK